jgi:hypothetical protein
MAEGTGLYEQANSRLLNYCFYCNLKKCWSRIIYLIVSTLYMTLRCFVSEASFKVNMTNDNC